MASVALWRLIQVMKAETGMPGEALGGAQGGASAGSFLEKGHQAETRVTSSRSWSPGDSSVGELRGQLRTRTQGRQGRRPGLVRREACALEAQSCSGCGCCGGL